MKKQYYIPNYPQIKLVSLDGEYFYLDIITGKQCKIKKYESVNKFLSKICITSKNSEYWGLVDQNNNLVLPCIYLSIQINVFGNISVIYPKASYNPNSDFLEQLFYALI